ncbi:MAG: CTP-dependent riboflavin kinase [Candidatus Thorarchaeota archaeon]|nr:CTP-dependent riboflavin kinase [Candidatus Thorarchaeota archaeon]
MLTPEVLFTLYALAKRGAVHKRCNLTTTELGTLLGVSQQTASRRISACVSEGLLERAHTARGVSVQLTEKGQKELLEVLTTLEIAFTAPSDEIVIEGTVVTGLGEGAYYVEVYAERFREKLGFAPFPGTLNVKVRNDESLKAVTMMKHTPPLVVRGFMHDGRTFGDVICYRVRINGSTDGAVVIAQRTHHSPEILEVISPVNLRKSLGLNEHSEVTLSVIPLHMAV